MHSLMFTVIGGRARWLSEDCLFCYSVTKDKMFEMHSHVHIDFAFNHT